MKRSIQVVTDISGKEAIYIDNWLEAVGNPLNEDMERVLWFRDLANNFGIKIKNLEFYRVRLEEDTTLTEFPKELITMSADLEFQRIF